MNEEVGARQTRRVEENDLLHDQAGSIQLSNGTTLELSTLDSYFLNLWHCKGKKYRSREFKILKKYGSMKTISTFFVKSQSKSISF